jgi:hypothetical protein
VNRVLSHSLFNQSRRYAQFLRHVTELALANHGRAVTERDLGVEIFSRSPNYDTDADPIVRVTASEIRKRLARYYADPEHAGEIRIALLKGSYLADFQLAPPQPATEIVIPSDTAASQPKPGPAHLDRTLRFYLGLGAALCALSALLWNLQSAPSALSLFWRPLMNTPGAVLISYADLSAENLHVAGVANPEFTWTDPLTAVPYPLGIGWSRLAEDLVFAQDLTSVSRIAEFVGSKEKHALFRGAHALMISDLRDTPAIFLGGFNNQWTARLLPQVRFSFSGKGNLRFIRDSKNPGSTDWSFDSEVRPRAKDLIIVSRVSDSPTGQPAVFAGGFSNWGTEAAVAFLTNTQHMQAAFSHAPKHWESKNLQLVLETTVVGGRSGVPRVLATHFW